MPTTLSRVLLLPRSPLVPPPAGPLARLPALPSRPAPLRSHSRPLSAHRGRRYGGLLLFCVVRFRIARPAPGVDGTSRVLRLTWRRECHPCGKLCGRQEWVRYRPFYFSYLTPLPRF